MPHPVRQLTSLDGSRSRVAFTASAREVIAEACRRGGPQIIVLAWPGGAAYLPADSYQPSEFDVVVACVDGCPVYADTRRLAMSTDTRVVFDADAYTLRRPNPPLRLSSLRREPPELAYDDARFESARTGVCDDLTRELTPQYAGVCSEQTISRYVRAAVDDLRGSASAEALPELAARLARLRLMQH